MTKWTFAHGCTVAPSTNIKDWASKHLQPQIHHTRGQHTPGNDIMSGKRANTFGQGRPERPYEERDEEPADTPQKATAAQLATRK
jgi:hypothetical protein